jgi:hypothetical protein
MNMATIQKYWSRIPLIIRAILNGITVQIIGFALLITLLPLLHTVSARCEIAVSNV